MHQQSRIQSRDIHPVYQIRPLDQPLQLGHAQPRHLLLLALAESFLFPKCLFILL